MATGHSPPPLIQERRELAETTGGRMELDGHKEFRVLRGPEH